MDRERELGIDKPTSLLEAEQEKLDELGVSVREVTIGYSNKIIRGDFQGSECYAKIFARPDRFRNERDWLQHIRGVGIDFVPDILATFDGDEQNNPLLVISKVNGTILKTAGDEQIQEMDTILASVINRLNEIVEKTHDPNVSIDQWIQERTYFINLWYHNIADSPECNEYLRSIARAAYDEFSNGLQLIQNIDKVSFVHSDINARNISIDEQNRIAGIIDFEFATYGDHIYDAVRIMWRLIGDHGPVGIEKLRRLGFAEFSEEEVERLRLYRLFNYLGSLSFYFSSGRAAKGDPSPEASIRGIEQDMLQG